jgi:hypothetical protein
MPTEFLAPFKPIAQELGAQTGPPQATPVFRTAPVASVRKCSCIAPVFEFVTFS